MKQRQIGWLMAIVILLMACSDDDSFTTSPSNLLTFSVDSVKLDTVFARVPSSTSTFWVYNKSGNGLRCSSVRLAQGNQTGFRVNVDGLYLGATEGFQTSEIEVRDGDSITFPSLSTEQRKMLGKIAKNCSWYKRIGLGEQFGNIVMSCMDSFGDNSAIKRNVNGLAEWVINDDEAGT